MTNKAKEFFEKAISDYEDAYYKANIRQPIIVINKGWISVDGTNYRLSDIIRSIEFSTTIFSACLCSLAIALKNLDACPINFLINDI